MRCLVTVLVLSVLAVTPNASATLICRGDVNLDGLNNGADIPAFTLAVISGSGGSPNATWAADVNESGAVDIADIGPFVDCLLNDCSTARANCFDPDIMDGVNVANGEHRIFVTSTIYSGNLGGYGGACAKCVQRAAAAGLQLTYKAVLSDNFGSAPERIQFHGGAIYKLNQSGQKTAVDLDGYLWNGIDATVNFDEWGATVGASFPWTGTENWGDPTPANTCDDWRDNDGLFFNGRVGSTTSISGWLSVGNSLCNSSRKLYCISQ
jgi:hypothetical protein